MPVFAEASPVPSSTSVTSTRTSFVARLIVARRFARAARVEDVATFFLGIGEHAPQRLHEVGVLVPRSNGHAQRARDHLREIAHQHTRIGKLFPQRAALAR